MKPLAFLAVDPDFVEAMRACWAGPVRTIKLGEQRDDEFLFIEDMDLPRSLMPLAPNIILLRCESVPQGVATLERLGVAAGIEMPTFINWARIDAGFGVGGRRDVIARIGGVEIPAFTGINYAFYNSKTTRRLPETLAEYLAAY